MARLGADPEDLDRLADQFASGKKSLANANSGLGSRLNSTSWTGPDSDNFRAWWSRTGGQSLNSASYYMGSLSDYVRQQAQEQRWASQGAGHRMSWPGRPPHWADPVHPSLRRGPAGPGNWSNDGCGSQGDPVDSATGAMWFVEPDAVLTAPGHASLTLDRTHHGWFDDSLSFGFGWVSILDSHVVTNGDRVGVLAPDGSFLQFVDADDELSPIAGVAATLSRTPTGFKLMAADGQVLVYGSSGVIENVGTATDLGFAFGVQDGQVESIRQPGGTEIAVVRDSDGRVTSIGELCSYTYDDDGHLVEAANSEGTAKYEWDDRHRVVHQWDRRGRTVVQTEFDDHGRVSSQLDPHGQGYSFSWDEGTGRSVMTDPLGNEWTDRYIDGVLVERTNPLGAGVAYERDGVDIVAETGPDGIRRPSEVSQLEDSEIVDGKLVRLGDMAFEYDESGQLVGLSQGDSTVALSRDPEHPDRIVRISDPSGEESTCAYDEVGRLIELSGPDGKALFGFDGDDISSVELLTDDHHLKIWTESGTLQREIDGVATVISTTDEEGRVSQIFDDLGRPQSFAYDEWDRLTSTTGPSGERTSYSYDVFDRLGCRIDSADRELSIQRDAAQRMVGLTTEDGAHFSFELDPMGRLVGVTTGEERELAYERNDVGSVVSATGRKLSRTLSYAEDGRLESLTSGADETGLVYDDLGRVIRIESSASGEVAYEYNLAGAVTAKTVDGVRTEIGYLGSLEANYKSDVGEVVLTADSEDVLTLRLPNGIDSAATWKDGRLASLEATGPDGALWSEKYELDAIGNVESIESLQSRWDFEYDERDMITSAELQGAESRSLAWNWNSVGTRLSKAVDGVEQLSTLDEHARVISVESSGVVEEIEYGDAGRVVRSGGWAYRYDGEGNLVEARGSASTVSHTYDAFSNRVRTMEESSDGKVLRDVSIGWDLSTELPEPVLAVDNLTGRREIYQYGPMGAPMCVFPADAPDEVRWFVTDAHGTIRVVTDEQGQSVGSRTYDPFGVVLSEQGEFDTGLLQLGYLGAIQDTTTGLCHLRERDYDPDLGRFLAPDPELMPMGMSVITGYAYAFNRPLALSDPSGRWPLQGMYKKAKSAVTSVVNTARDVGSAVVEKTTQVAKSVYRSAAPIVSRVARRAADGLSSLGGMIKGSFPFRHARWLVPVMSIAAIAIAVVASGGTVGLALLPALAAGALTASSTAGAAALVVGGGLAIAAMGLGFVVMLDGVAKAGVGLAMGDDAMMFAGLGDVLGFGVSILAPWARFLPSMGPILGELVDSALGFGLDELYEHLAKLVPTAPKSL